MCIQAVVYLYNNCVWVEYSRSTQMARGKRDRRHADKKFNAHLPSPSRAPDLRSLPSSLGVTVVKTTTLSYGTVKVNCGSVA